MQHLIDEGCDKLIVEHLDSKVSCALCQVIDHEIRLFKEIEALRVKSNQIPAACFQKAMRIIDTNGRDGLDKKSVLKFLNSNIDGSQLQMSDMTTVFKRLQLKAVGVNSYIDVYNSIN